VLASGTSRYHGDIRLPDQQVGGRYARAGWNDRGS
jgi:hypothetical protein